MMRKFLNVLIRPFGDGLQLLVLLFLLIAIAPIGYYWHSGGAVAYTIFANLVIAYAVTLLIYSLRGKWQKGMKVLVSCYCIVYFIVTLFCVNKFKRTWSLDFVAAIYGTNLNETSEFFHTFVDINYILHLLLCAAAICVVTILAKKIHLHKNIKYIGLFFVIVCLLLCVRNYNFFKNETIIGHTGMMFNIDHLEDLHDYLTSPQLVAVDSEKPQNIVLIIGESFTRVHSSLYGYDKPTSPCLAQLRDSARLYLYDRISSPKTCTVLSFKEFMSTWSPDMGDEWYRGVTIPEIAKLCGYHSYWISNQSKKGMWDNVVGLYADLCDKELFVGNRFSGVHRSTYDEEVLPLLRKVIGGGTRSFYFVHLMGSHSAFRSRYPEDRNYFKASDYKNYPAKQREKRAAYDNSVLYNDSVVYEIMRSFDREEAIVVYFSDHALDVYQSSDDYCAHANLDDSKSKAAGEAIPFMIYVTDRYKAKFPDKVAHIKQTLHKKYSTGNLIYTVMDIIGVEFAQNRSSAKLSLLNCQN